MLKLDRGQEHQKPFLPEESGSGELVDCPEPGGQGWGGDNDKVGAGGDPIGGMKGRPIMLFNGEGRWVGGIKAGLKVEKEVTRTNMEGVSLGAAMHRTASDLRPLSVRLSHGDEIKIYPLT